MAPIARRSTSAAPGSAKKHPLTGEAYNNLAINMEKQGQPPSVIEPMFRKALDITRASLGETSQRTATLYANVAHILNEQGRYSEAEPMYRRALDIQERITGTEHPSYATTLLNLAFNMSDDGRDDRAEPMMRRALGFSAPGSATTIPKRRGPIPASARRSARSAATGRSRNDGRGARHPAPPARRGLIR